MVIVAVKTVECTVVGLLDGPPSRTHHRTELEKQSRKNQNDNNDGYQEDDNEEPLENVVNFFAGFI